MRLSCAFGSPVFFAFIINFGLRVTTFPIKHASEAVFAENLLVNFLNQLVQQGLHIRVLHFPLIQQGLHFHQVVLDLEQFRPVRLALYVHVDLAQYAVVQAVQKLVQGDQLVVLIQDLAQILLELVVRLLSVKHLALQPHFPLRGSRVHSARREIREAWARRRTKGGLFLDHSSEGNDILYRINGQKFGF